MSGSCSGLLAPRNGEKHPWLMPAMASSRMAAYDPFGRGILTLYSRRPVWVDFQAGGGGDGSRERPVNSLQRVFADPGIQCVCRHLGADRIPVFVRGRARFRNAHHCFDGKNMNFFRHLELRKWPGGSRPEIIVECENFSQEQVGVFLGFTGLYVRDFNFTAEIVVRSEDDVADAAFSVFFAPFLSCPSLVAVGCRAKGSIRIVRGMEDTEDPGGGGGGEGGEGGGGGGGGGGGWYPWIQPPGEPDDEPYPFPEVPPEEPAQYDVPPRAHGVLAFLADCPGALVRDCTCAFSLDVKDSVAAAAEAYGMLRCLGADVAKLTANLTAKAMAKNTTAQAGDRCAVGAYAYTAVVAESRPLGIATESGAQEDGLIEHCSGTVRAEAVASAPEGAIVDGSAVATANGFRDSGRYGSGNHAGTSARVHHPSGFVRQDTRVFA